MSDFQPIVSSNLETAAYDAAKQVITVRFQNGKAYRYANCGSEFWNDFKKTFDGKNDRSAGKFFYAHIRPMPAEQLDDWK